MYTDKIEQMAITAKVTHHHSLTHAHTHTNTHTHTYMHFERSVHQHTHTCILYTHTQSLIIVLLLSLAQIQSKHCLAESCVCLFMKSQRVSLPHTNYANCLDALAFILCRAAKTNKGKLLWI